METVVQSVKDYGQLQILANNANVWAKILSLTIWEFVNSVQFRTAEDVPKLIRLSAIIVKHQ